jgi:hypothetical protein
MNVQTAQTCGRTTEGTAFTKASHGKLKQQHILQQPQPPTIPELEQCVVSWDSSLSETNICILCNRQIRSLPPLVISQQQVYKVLFFWWLPSPIQGVAHFYRAAQGVLACWP